MSCKTLRIMLAVLPLLLVSVAVVGEGELECTVYVQPGESIQAAIDVAPVGAVICISEGEWQEDLAIEKALTLRGQGSAKTIIRGDSSPSGVLAIYCLDAETSGDVSVRIEGMTITGGAGAGIVTATDIQATVSECDVKGNRSGIDLRDNSRAEFLDCRISENTFGVQGIHSAQATMTNCTVSGNRAGGIGFALSAGVAISNSTISENGRSGILLSDSAQAAITSSTVVDNDGDGLTLGDSSHATLVDCDVIENGFENAQAGRYQTEGILLNGDAQISLDGCTVTGNANEGLVLTDAAEADISVSTISGNGRIGVWLLDTARATLYRCTIADHPSAGVDARNETVIEMTACLVERNYAGVTLWGSPHATLVGNTIRNCQGRGVGAVGPDGEIDGFTGYVTGEGNAVTENGAGLNCDPCAPQYLCFLESEEGGELDERE